jgi:hypothetical protein
MCRTSNDYFPLPLRSARWLGATSFAERVHTIEPAGVTQVAVPEGESNLAAHHAQEELIVPARSYEVTAQRISNTSTTLVTTEP